MKIVKEIEIGGVMVTYDQLKTEMEKHGVKASKFVDREPASLPSVGTFDRFEPAGKGEFAHYRMIAKDAKGAEHIVSISRLQAYGLIKTKPESELPVNAIRKSTKGNFYISGDTVNPEIPSDQAKAALSLVGQKFKAKRITLFSLPFGVTFESKEQAASEVGTMSAFELTFVD